MSQFTQALETKCSDCGAQAQAHRLTNSGNFYCLNLNDSGTSAYVRSYYRTNKLKTGYATKQEVPMSLLMRCPVRFLYRSPLPKLIGEIINKGLHSYVAIA